MLHLIQFPLRNLRVPTKLAEAFLSTRNKEVLTFFFAQRGACFMHSGLTVHYCKEFGGGVVRVVVQSLCTVPCPYLSLPSLSAVVHCMV